MMQFGLCQQGTMRSQLFEFQLREVLSPLILVSELVAHPIEFFHSNLLNQCFDTAVLFTNPKGSVDERILSDFLTQGLYVKEWDRNFVLQYDLGFCTALVITDGLLMEGRAQIKPMVTHLKKEVKPCNDTVTTFYLGERDNWPDTNLWDAEEEVYIIPPHPDGIYAAHKRLCDLCPTDAFCVVDDDSCNVKLPTFPKVIRHNLIYYARNPYNGLEYGHGGLKVFLRSAFLASDPPPPNEDMTLWVSRGCGLEVIPEVCSEHHYGGSPYQAWRGTFRECFKLARTARESAFNYQRLQEWVDKSLGRNKSSARFGIAMARSTPDFPINNEAALRELYLRFLTENTLAFTNYTRL